MILGDIVLVVVLGLLVYLQPQFLLKRYSLSEKSMVLPSTRHVLRELDSFQENAIQADLLLNSIPKNKFIFFPKYSIVTKKLQSCPDNTCDDISSKDKVCTAPNVKTGENVWCTSEVLKQRQFKNLETIDFLFYRRVYAKQYERLVKQMDLHGKPKRRNFETQHIGGLTGFDRLNLHLRYADQLKSFVAGSQFVAKISFQELYFKVKVNHFQDFLFSILMIMRIYNLLK
jgi:hypothetical protein